MEQTKMPPSPTKLVLYLEDIYYVNFKEIILKIFGEELNRAK